jgi:hypothetical protein
VPEAEFVVIGPEVRHLVGPVAAALMTEMRLFGRLTAEGSLDEGMLTEYATTRAGFALSLVETLQGMGAIRFRDDVHVPYLYHTAGWPAELGPSGYGLADRPHTWVLSQFVNWHARTSGSAAVRLLRAALWQVHQGGLQRGVGYLFDLYDWGLAGRDDLASALAVLLRARCQVGGDAELVERMSSDPGAVGTPLETTWVDETAVPCDAVSEVVTALLDRAQQDIVEAREAGDIDEWADRQIHLGGTLRVISQAVRDLPVRLPLAWRARLGQWDEIVADAGGLNLAAHAGYWWPTFAHLMSSAGVMAGAVRAEAGDDWQERFVSERLLVPAALQDVMLPALDEGRRDVVGAPPEWEQLSWRSIHAWAAVYRSGQSPDLTPADRPRDPAATPEERREWLQDAMLSAITADEAGDHVRAAAASAAVARRYPYFPMAAQEEAIAHHRNGDLTAATDRIRVALFLSPRDPAIWQSAAAVLDALEAPAERRLAQALRHVLQDGDAPRG